MNPGLFTGEQIKALRENPFTDFVSATTIRFTVEFKEMFVSAMDSGRTIRSIFQDSGYDPDVLGRARMKSFAHRVRKEKRKNKEFHNGYKERKQHPDLADYASMTREEAILRMQNEILYLHQELDFIKKIIELDRQGGQKP